MDGKIIAYLLVLASMFGLFYGVNYTMVVDDLRADLDRLEQDMKGVDENLRIRQANLAQRKELLALQIAGETLKSEIDALQKNVAAVKASQADVEKTYIESVQRVRADSVGLKLPELALGGGRVLRLARIQRIETDAVTFAHAEGVLRVKPEELPADLQARLGYVLEMPVQIPST